MSDPEKTSLSDGSHRLEVQTTLLIMRCAQDTREVVKGSLSLLLLSYQGGPIDLKHVNMIPLSTLISM
jgi:hypothetical protein